MPELKIPSKLAFFLLAFMFSSHALPVEAGVQTYGELVHAIREVRAASQARIETAVEQEKMREAWEIGKLIDTHVLQHQRANYAERVVVKLANDLGTSRTELQYMLEFARTYPIVPPAGQLSWAHYRELLSLNDIEERNAVADEAVRQGWSRDQVREEVRRRQAARKPSQENVHESVLTAKPGKVGVYRVIRAKAGPFRGGLAVDLGFANYYQPKEIKKFKEGNLVRLEKGKLKKIETDRQRRTAPTLGADAAVVRQQAQLYTYFAYVSAVIDGDTFKAVIDLGFNIVTEQKLRLRGLDAPEIESAEGKEAKEFLTKELAKSGGPVLIRTVKSDKYDRYLADVFLPGSPSAPSPEDSDYLNQKLIEAGLAHRVEGS